MSFVYGAARILRTEHVDWLYIHFVISLLQIYLAIASSKLILDALPLRLLGQIEAALRAMSA